VSLTVRSLNLYPVKSCGGIKVSEFQIGESGPQISVGNSFVGDREWMFVDANGKFLTQRSLQKMALIHPLIEDGRFFLQIEKQKFEVPLQPEKVKRQIVSVWGKEIDAAVVDDDLSKAASDFLGTSAQLVHFDSLSQREILVKGRGMNAQTRFTDSQAYLVVTEESLKDLNSRLKSPIGYERFRSNILLSGSKEPFAEDRWQHLGHEALVFESTRSCARCKIITVDPESGKIPSPEPLTVLASFRRRETAVYFGQYFLSRSYGEVLKVGDHLEVQEYHG